MSVEFAVGKRVVCIDDAWRSSPIAKRTTKAKPLKGMVYTITDIVPNPHWKDHIGLELAEVQSGHFFDSIGFRPVRETSIDCLTALLTKPPVRLREDV